MFHSPQRLHIHSYYPFCFHQVLPGIEASLRRSRRQRLKSAFQRRHCHTCVACEFASSSLNGGCVATFIRKLLGCSGSSYPEFDTILDLLAFDEVGDFFDFLDAAMWTTDADKIDFTDLIIDVVVGVFKVCFLYGYRV
jgi:hypothetical protein